MRRLTVSLVCVIAFLLVSGPADAQQLDRRAGFWWGFGVSYGWAHVQCDICLADRAWALSGTGNLGGTIHHGLLLGAELSGWTHSVEEVDEYLGSLSAVAQWYPNRDGRFYLKGGLGYLAYRIDDGEDALTSSGFGPQLGAGYEFYISRHASIQPYLNLIITIPRGNLYFNGDRQAEGVSLSLVQLGLGVTWH